MKIRNNKIIDNNNNIIAVFNKTNIHVILPRRLPINLLKQIPTAWAERLIENIRANDRRHEASRKARKAAQVQAIAATEPQQYGLEIEFIAPRNMNGYHAATVVENAIGQACTFERYTHDHASSWKVVTDGSLRGNGFELVTPPQTDLELIEKAVNALRAEGCTTNRSCGLHVHMDVKGDRGIARKIAELYMENSSIIETIFKATRLGNQWCRRLTQESIDRVCRFIDSENWRYRDNQRYVTVNLLPIREYGTVEFRQCEGTLDIKKITRVVNLYKGLISYIKKAPKKAFANMKEMLDAFEITDQRWFLSRERHVQMA